MTEKELAEHIKDRVIMIGTALKQMESIIKYSQDDKTFRDAFAMMYISLQNFVYIELFKIFDTSGKDTKGNTIHTLINMMENKDKVYHKMISKYNTTIESIKNQRNHYFAHDTGKISIEVFEQNSIKSLQEMLKSIAKICCAANDKLYPNTYASNVKDFDDWCYMAIDSMNEVLAREDYND